MQQSVGKVIVGKPEAVRQLVIALIAGGHVLLEDLPGTGKTMMLRAFSRSIGGTFRRIQCTPDLMPSDLTGINFYNQKEGRFEFRPGPLFANIVLADEINRATPRSQSALLEVMEEKQVSIDGASYPMQEPYLVMATENPIEFAGTFPLPEAQMDRFFLKITVGYPTVEEEMDVLERYSGQISPMQTLTPVCGAADIIAMQEQVGTVYASRGARIYVATMVSMTRTHPALQLGASPRGSIALLRAAQACALLSGRDYVLPDDIRHMALPVLSHRLILTPEARMKGVSAQQVLSQLIETVPVPTGRV